MFGDLGHGFLMATFAAWMVWKEKPLQAKKTDNEVCAIYSFGIQISIIAVSFIKVRLGSVIIHVFSSDFQNLRYFFQVIK